MLHHGKHAPIQTILSPVRLFFENCRISNFKRVMLAMFYCELNIGSFDLNSFFVFFILIEKMPQHFQNSG